MTTPAQLAWLDQDDQLTTELVRRHGWRIIYVVATGETGPDCAPDCPCRRDGSDEGPPRPAFAYTVGLFGLGHPELLIFSVPPEVAAAVLNELASQISAGANLAPGRMLELPRWNRRAVTEQVANPGAIVYAANSFYRRPAEASVPVLQVGYDDRQGRFPWDPDYDEGAGRQPRPGTFAA